MVLKINQQEAIVLILQARREYRLLRGKKSRGLFLDRLSEETGYDRKHLIKLLNSKKRKIAQKRGAPIKLTGEDIDLVRRIWALSHYTNAEYLQQNIHRWLTDYSSTLEEPLSKNQIKRISSVSYKTLDRALKAYRCEQPVRNWLSKLAPFFRYIGSKFKPRLLVSIWRMCVLYHSVSSNSPSGCCRMLLCTVTDFYCSARNAAFPGCNIPAILPSSHSLRPDFSALDAEKTHACTFSRNAP